MSTGAKPRELCIGHVQRQAWRVGYRPAPWAWSGWEYAGADGRFHGRWDDRLGNFRTVYAGSTLLACLLEVLAGLRADPVLVDELAEIHEDGNDAVLHPTAPAGQVPYAWLEPRAAASATLNGSFCYVSDSRSIAALRPHFIGLATHLGLEDFDAAALKDGRPRELTQAVATHLHAATEVAGVAFLSRLGDDLELWAIFERAGDPEVSPSLRDINDHVLTPENPDVIEAFRVLGLEWASDD